MNHEIIQADMKANNQASLNLFAPVYSRDGRTVTDKKNLYYEEERLIEENPNIYGYVRVNAYYQGGTTGIGNFIVDVTSAITQVV